MNSLSIPRSLIRARLFKAAIPIALILRPLPVSVFAVSATRPFTSSLSLPIKKGRKDTPSPSESSPAKAEMLGFDAEFEKLESDIARAADKLKEDLGKLRTGRADPSILEGLPVAVNKGDGTTVPLRDVAHVVTKGRGLAATVYETANVKRVISAIQIADLNLQPVVDPKNAQLVNVPLPPPTKESRNDMVVDVAKFGNKALDGVKNARLAMHKKIQAAKKTMRPDDVKKADKKMEDIVKKRKAEVEAIIAAAKKGVLEG